MTSTMQAVYLSGHGGNEVVHAGPRPLPQAGPGEVLLRMRAATLNQVDLYMRNSGAGITHTLPQIMGIDGCGVVVTAPPDTNLKPGERVVVHAGIGCGVCEFCQRGDDVLCLRMSLLGEHRDGTWAEFLTLPARNAMAAPDYLSDLEAAALGVTHLTAWRMLHTQARLRAGETVLITGIGGGVSLAGLQLAKAMGARVLVTSRHANKLARAKAMGADVGIDSTREDVARAALAATQGRGVDVVFENIGGPAWGWALKSLVRGGRVVTCGATAGDQPGADLRRIFIRQLQVYGSTLGNLQDMHALLDFCQRKRIRPVFDQVFPLAQAHAALDLLASGTQFGKIGLLIAD